MIRWTSAALALICFGMTSNTALALPRGLMVYAACPATFPTEKPNHQPKLIGVEQYYLYAGLQEPSQYPKKDEPDDIVTGDGPSALRCVYQHDQEIVVELQKQVTGCWYRNDSRKQLTVRCTGPKTSDPVPLPKIFVTRHLDAQSTLRGFGLARTVAEIEAAAEAQGTKAEITATDNGQTARIAYLDGQSVEILFSPQGLSREIVWQTNGQTLFDNPLMTTVQLFGFFTDFEDEYYIWDYHHGIVLLADRQIKTMSSKIRLIDQRTAGGTDPAPRSK